MSRTKKKDYTRAKAFCRSCRNHGSCEYCEGNRLIQSTRAEARADDEERTDACVVPEEPAD
jgi:hypothetical protein